MSARYPTRPRGVPPKTGKASKKRVANVVLVYSFAFITVYTAVMTWAFIKYQVEAPVLNGCVYGLFGTELAGMLVKRIFDKKKDKEDTTDEN